MILFFFPDLRAGGAERVMLNLLERFYKEKPTEVALLLGKKQGKLLEQIPPDIQIYEIGASSALRSVLPLIQFIWKHRPEKIFSTLGSSLAAAIAKPFLPVKTELIGRLGNTIGAEKKLLRSGFKQRLYIGASQWIAKKSDKVIFQCRYMAEDFIRETGITPKSYRAIYNPVHIDKIEKLQAEQMEKSQDFVAVGRLSHQKDYITLIKAFEILKKDYNKDWVVRILGEGQLKEVLQREIRERGLMGTVVIEGFTPNPYAYIRNAKVLVSTSLFEGFSNVIVEALCIGTPVIASDCPGANSEVIVEGQNGFFFETGNATDLAKVIIGNIETVESMDRKKISEEAKERFNLNAIFEEYYTYIYS